MRRRLRHRHSIMSFTVFTRMTMIGKVKNINQMETSSDFFISSNLINFFTKNCVVAKRLVPLIAKS